MLRTAPAAGSTPECGSSVTIVVSSGPEPCPEGEERETPTSPCEPVVPTCTSPQVLDPESNTCYTPECPAGEERETPTSPCEPIEVECSAPQVPDPESNTCVTPQETETETDPETGSETETGSIG